MIPTHTYTKKGDTAVSFGFYVLKESVGSMMLCYVISWKKSIGR